MMVRVHIKNKIGTVKVSEARKGDATYLEMVVALRHRCRRSKA